MKRLFLLIIAISLVLVSCKKDDQTDTEKYINEVSSEIEKLDADLAVTFGAVKNDAGVLAISRLIEMFSSSTQFQGSQAVAQTLSVAINKTSSLPAKPALPYPGTYTWNFAQLKWDIAVGSPADAIVAVFPSEKSNGEVNNCTVTIKNVGFGLFLGKSWMPKSLKVTVDINGVVVGIIEHTTTWPETSPLPYVIDSKVVFGPFDVTLKGMLNPVTKGYNIKSELKVATKVMSSTDITLHLDMANPQLPVTGGEGFFQYGQMKFDGKVDLKPLAMAKYLGKPITVEVLNACVDMKLYHFASNTYMGQVYIKDIVDGEPLIYIKMVDGKDIPFIPVLLKSLNLGK